MCPDEFILRVLSGEKDFSRIALPEGSNISYRDGFEEMNKFLLSEWYVSKPLNLEYSQFKSVGLRGVFFHGVQAKGIDFRGADLSLADFSYSSLVGVDFREADISLVDFYMANLCLSDFRNVLDVSNSRFEGADLRGMALDEETYLEMIRTNPDIREINIDVLSNEFFYKNRHFGSNLIN